MSKTGPFRHGQGTRFRHNRGQYKTWTFLNEAIELR